MIIKKYNGIAIGAIDSRNFVIDACRKCFESSTEFPTNGYQNPKPTQPKHSGNNRLNRKRDVVPDGVVESLIVEKDDK